AAHDRGRAFRGVRTPAAGAARGEDRTGGAGHCRRGRGMSSERGTAFGKGQAVGLTAGVGVPPVTAARTARWRLVALWSTFLLLDAVTQLAFKWGGLGLAGVEFGPVWLDTAARSIAVWVAIAGYGALFVVWVIILQGSD